MPVQEWSDEITVVELADDPMFSDDMDELTERLTAKPTDVVLNLAGVGFMNSSNIAQLLRLRKHLLQAHRRLIVSDVNSQVWGLFLVTGLDKIFEFTNDVAIALAGLQLAEGEHDD